MLRRRSGFTLVETLLALALCALLAAGGLAAVGRLAPKFQLRSAAWVVTSSLNQARFQAILTGETRRVRFAPPGLRLERYDASAGQWVFLRAAALPGVRVQANNAPAFHPQGTVSDLATITLTNSQGGYRITVAITGRIRAVRTS
jgi:prepilin-type N-terminal cleavage/methylation domain-containing protein